jgi:hypothetical protein
MATIDTSGISPGQIIRSVQLLNVINALNGVNPVDIIITGSLSVSGSTSLSGSTFLKGIPNTSRANVITYDPTTGQLSYLNSASLGVTMSVSQPGGLNTQIQYNSGSVLAATSSFTFNYTLQSLQQGNNVLASSTFAHAQGNQTTASGQYSHAEGATTQAKEIGSHAEGISTIASGSYSHAEGNQTIAIGNSSHAEGATTIASGSHSHAEGSGSLSIGLYSHAEGESTQAKGYASHAEGHLTNTEANYSHAEGFGTTTSGIYSHAEGDFSEARGQFSHAEGYQYVPGGIQENVPTTAEGTGSHAEGRATYAVGEGSHAEGDQTYSSGSWSHAEGINTIARGEGSHAEGRLTTSSGNYSHAEGWNTVASGTYQHVQGQFNILSSAQSAFIIGNGTSNANRRNLVFASGSIFQITGSLQVSGSITGSLFGTASHVLNQLVTSSLIDSYIGTRIFPTSTTSNGFAVDTNVNGAVGLVIRNSDTSGNGAYSAVSLATSGSWYDTGNAFIYFNSGYYVTSLRDTGGIFSGTNSNILLINNKDFAVQTGATLTTLSTKFKVSGSGNVYIPSGNLEVSGSITGSLFGTASYATQALSASWAPNPSPIAVIGSTLYSTSPAASSANTTGSIFLGNQAGAGVTGASNSNFLGNLAGSNTTSTYNSNFLGQEAGRYATLAFGSNFLGYFAGSYGASASYSNFLGANAGEFATNANNSNFFGQSAGRFAASASYSTLIGYRVGLAYNATGSIGSNNIIIGTNITLPAQQRDSINLGGIIFATGSYFDAGIGIGTPFSGSMPNAKVGIGTSTPQFTLDVSGSTRLNGNTIITGSLDITGSNSYNLNVIGNAAVSSYMYANVFQGNFAVGGAGNVGMNGAGGNTNIFTSGNSAGITFSSGSLFANARELMRITNTGSVGIGTSTPQFTLDVSGSARITNGLTVSGSALSSSIVEIIGSGSSRPLFTVQGSQGELFSVTDSLSGSLFSVNDISGLPIMEVFSDGTTLMGNYLDPMLTTTAKNVLTNSGSFTIYSLPTASYDTAFFDYSVRSGSNARAGQIMAIQSGSSVNFTEVTSSAFGTTTGLSLGVFVSGSNMVLTGSAATSAWTIKTIIRSI